ncbi:MAG: hypothetical protein MJ212_04100 [Alphaproteobacteria bacterium]|nr:hypothetical protein [Alphaproteobacteria bacterium]
MSYTSTELAEIVSTRIAHDLGGTIGALGSALELIAENNNIMDTDTQAIITSATHTLKARQRFLRIAFGLNTNTADSDELKRICEDYLATFGNPANPINLQISAISPKIAKPVFLCIMAAADVCMRGGIITIEMNQSSLTLHLTSGYKLVAGKIDIYKEIIKGDKPKEYISQYIQLIYLRELLGNDVPMTLTTSENEMTLIIG